MSEIFVHPIIASIIPYWIHSEDQTRGKPNLEEILELESIEKCKFWLN